MKESVLCRLKKNTRKDGKIQIRMKKEGTNTKPCQGKKMQTNK